MRRSHNALASSALSEDQETGEIHLRHHVSADGYYKGKKIINNKDSEPEETES